MQLEAPRGLWKKRPNADSNRFAISIYIYIYLKIDPNLVRKPYTFLILELGLT